MVSNWELNMWHKKLWPVGVVNQARFPINYNAPFYKLCTGYPVKVIPIFFEIYLHPFK